MAKALYGHVGIAADQRLRDEVQRLRGTVQALEFELARLRAENDRLSAEFSSRDTAHAGELDRITIEEPALT